MVEMEKENKRLSHKVQQLQEHISKVFSACLCSVFKLRCSLSVGIRVQRTLEYVGENALTSA